MCMFGWRVGRRTCTAGRSIREVRAAIVIAIIGVACASGGTVEPRPEPDPILDPNPNPNPNPSPNPNPNPNPNPSPGPGPDTARIGELLAAHPEQFALALSKPEEFRIQIVVTTFDPIAEYRYRADAEYVFPASSIKTFAAVAALLALQDLQEQGHGVDLQTPMRWCRREACDVQHDRSNLDGGTITIGHEIRKMQLVSDNYAFNRLYDFVGHRELNETVWALGFPNVRIKHRMYGRLDERSRRTTPRIEMHPPGGEPVVIPRRVSDLPLSPHPIAGVKVGRKHYDHRMRLHDGPLDFGNKNHSAITDLHRLTIALNRPDFPGIPQLPLSAEHRAFLLQAMSEDPLASTNPVYRDKKEHLRYKLLIKGVMRVIPLERIRYVAKSGRAYGFHSDSAYIEDTATGRAIAVTAVVHANDDGIVGDDVYIYDELSRPFFKDLGEVLAREFLVER
jgi:hypothetical protein